MPLPLTFPFRAYTSFIYHMRTCFNKVRPMPAGYIKVFELNVVAMVDLFVDKWEVMPRSTGIGL